MFVVQKDIEIAASHCLNLPYDSKCNTPHGHNYKISVIVASESLNDEDMVLDFSSISREVKKWDHVDLNVVFAEQGYIGRPTAENMAMILLTNLQHICPDVAKVVRVDVVESGGSYVSYRI